MMNENQRLTEGKTVAESASVRWWQESVTPIQTEESATLPVRDIGEELEEEARQRVLLRGFESKLALDFQKASAKRFQMISVFFGAVVLLYTALILAYWVRLHRVAPVELFIKVGAYSLYPFLFNFMRRRMKPGELSISKEGIALRLPYADYGLIRWDEIAEIREYKLTLGGSFIGIEPRDSRALAKRIGGRAGQMIGINAFLNRGFVRRGRGKFRPTIFIQTAALPVTTDVLMAQIAVAKGMDFHTEE